MFIIYKSSPDACGISDIINITDSKELAEIVLENHLYNFILAKEGTEKADFLIGALNNDYDLDKSKVEGYYLTKVASMIILNHRASTISEGFFKSTRVFVDKEISIYSIIESESEIMSKDVEVPRLYSKKNVQIPVQESQSDVPSVVNDNANSEKEEENHE